MGLCSQRHPTQPAIILHIMQASKLFLPVCDNFYPDTRKTVPRVSARRVLQGLLLTVLTAVLPAISLGCAATGTVHGTPRGAVEALREAVRSDQRMEFLGTLSLDTLREYEHTILVAWDRVRDAYGFLGTSAEVISVEPTTVQTASMADPTAGEGWVWPASECPAVRVRLRVEWRGETFTEDLLAVEEELPEVDNSVDSRFIRSGEQSVLTERHPNPGRVPRAAPGPRTGWKVLAPYWPFQGTSRLAHEIARAAEAGENR